MLRFFVCALFCIAAVAAENPPARFDALTHLMSKVITVQKSMMPSSSIPSLDKLMEKLPESVKRDFENTFDSRFVQLGLSVTSSQDNIKRALDKAHNFITSHAVNKHCMNFNGTHCGTFETVVSMMKEFMQMEGMDVESSSHVSEFGGTRPLASHMEKSESMSNIGISILFWLAFMLNQLAHLGDVKEAFGQLRATTTLSAAGEMRKQEQSTWEVITAAFPTFDSWRDEIGNTPYFDLLVKQLCADFVRSATSDDSLRSCWNAKKEIFSKEERVWTKISVFPEALAACFAFALVLRDGSMTSYCPRKFLSQHYQCSNGVYVGSMCVMVCESELASDGSVKIFRTLPTNVSTTMVCASNGKWYGGPNRCNEYALPVTTSPLLAANAKLR